MVEDDEDPLPCFCPIAPPTKTRFAAIGWDEAIAFQSH